MGEEGQGIQTATVDPFGWRPQWPSPARRVDGWEIGVCLYTPKDTARLDWGEGGPKWGEWGQLAQAAETIPRQPVRSPRAVFMIL